MMKTQRQSTRLRLALGLDADEATRWWLRVRLLGFQVADYPQDQRGAEQLLQIHEVADCARSLDSTCVKCNIRVSVQVAEHLHHDNLTRSPYSVPVPSE